MATIFLPWEKKLRAVIVYKKLNAMGEKNKKEKIALPPFIIKREYLII